MSLSIVSYIIGSILECESAFMLLPALVGFIYHEPFQGVVYIGTSLLALLLGFILKKVGSTSRSLYPREGIVSVSIGWIAMSLIGALPFVATKEIPHFIDALFETVSGFTTMGGSILNDVESLTHATLFWRSFTHWIGGMGVFVFIMAILPLMATGSMNLMKAESPGPSVSKFVPKVKDTAKILYGLYIGVTVLCTITLLFCGLNLFDSLTLTFGTVGTGGFGIKNDSISSYSSAVQIAIAIFMILSGINYSVYFCIIRGKIKAAFSIEEVRWYLLIVVCGVGLITLNIKDLYPTLGDSAKHALFQVASLLTSTGYSSTDFNVWPEFSKTLLLSMMIVGACSGSTGGGFKVSRIVILLKEFVKEIHTSIHPNLVKKIKMDGQVVSQETLNSTNAFISIYCITMVFSVVLLSINGFDFTTNVTAVIASLNNMGPGLCMVGPMGNYSQFSAFSKLVLIFDMLAGRLELFPILVMFFPSTWKKN